MNRHPIFGTFTLIPKSPRLVLYPSRVLRVEAAENPRKPEVDYEQLPVVDATVVLWEVLYRVERRSYRLLFAHGSVRDGDCGQRNETAPSHSPQRAAPPHPHSKAGFSPLDSVWEAGHSLRPRSREHGDRASSQ